MLIFHEVYGRLIWPKPEVVSNLRTLSYLCYKFVLSFKYRLHFLAVLRKQMYISKVRDSRFHFCTIVWWVWLLKKTVSDQAHMVPKLFHSVTIGPKIPPLLFLVPNCSRCSQMVRIRHKGFLTVWSSPKWSQKLS